MARYATSHGGLIGRQAHRGVADTVVSAWQLFLRSHTGTRNSILADEGFPLVNEAVEIPVAEIHPLLGQLLGRVGAQGNVDRRKV
jgi:hypothetical protein